MNVPLADVNSYVKIHLEDTDVAAIEDIFYHRTDIHVKVKDFHRLTCRG